MKSLGSALVVLLLVAAFLAGPASPARGADEKKVTHYAIEIGGVLCGYSTVTTSPQPDATKGELLVEQHLFMMLTALGSKFNTDMRFTFHVDPVSGRFTYHESRIEQGRLLLTAQMKIEDGVALCTSSLSEDVKKVPLDDDVILEQPLSAPHLVRDFVEGQAQEKTYRMLDLQTQEVQAWVHVRKGDAKLTLADQEIDAVVIERRNEATGVKLTQWIEKTTGRIVQTTVPPDRKVYLAKANVTKRIEAANLDASLLAKTNVAIADIHAIASMKVKATLEPTGVRPTPESLNVPGQTFEGTVVENRIEGVFEIEHPRYDGADAPAFPPVLAADDPLRAYLAADGFIEADDPVLVEAAQRITKDAPNAWEASRRLAAWVAKHIDYAIPGGVTARKTYDTRTGECGSHSILFAALCRAVGIPARVVWGCMYVPNEGGAFGQHAWNEVHMGKAGWIPIDTTADEIDFVDSGHIRIDVMEAPRIAVNLRTMEVLEHRLIASDATPGAVSGHAPYIGDYVNAASGRKVEAVEQNGALVLKLPGGAGLALREPDTEGDWRAKVTDRVYARFIRHEAGPIQALEIHEIIRMQKTAAPPTIDEDVPEANRPYLGSYLLAPLKATFEVVWRDGHLAVKDPLAKTTIGLQTPDARGRHLDEYGKNTISFEMTDGKVRALVVDSRSRFDRVDSRPEEVAPPSE